MQCEKYVFCAKNVENAEIFVENNNFLSLMHLPCASGLPGPGGKAHPRATVPSNSRAFSQLGAVECACFLQ
jgi:hypothetical protein